MKNTKSRKRILLSSIAMLLVALVALGSATYAWFTLNKTVTASPMQVKASVAEGLQINGSATEAKWNNTYTFDAGQKTLNPVSVNYCTDAKAYSTFPVTGNYYSTDTTAAGVYSTSNKNVNSWGQTTGLSLPASGEYQADDGYVAAYKVKIRSSNASKKLTGVKMNLAWTDTETTGNKASDFIRFAVLEGSTIKAVYAKGAEEVAAIKAVTTSGSTTTVTTNAQLTTETITNISVSDVNGSTPNDYTIYVWFEGQDAQCIDDYQGLSGSLDISFTYTSSSDLT